MIFCLIDTCSLINLLSKEDNFQELENLKFWQFQDELKLLLPETIKSEWDRQKLLEKDRYLQSVGTKYKHTREILNRSSIKIPEVIEEEEREKFDFKIETIDNLLKNAINISISTHVKSLIPDKQILQNGSRRAPFHNKIDSVKDAYIIFSTLEFLQESQIHNLLFISENKSDFGNPENKNRSIHPDISNDYPEINVDYYSDIFYALNDYKSQLPTIEIPHAVGENDNLIDEFDKGLISINKSDSILNQVYNYLKIRFEDIKILPAYLFIKDYPFETGRACHRSAFTLSYVNPEIVELFKTFEIKNDKLIDNFQTQSEFKKALFILRALSENNIFNIKGIKREDFVTIRVLENKQSPTLLDKLNQFRFIEVYKKLDSLIPANKVDQYLEIGFLLYKVGDLIKSKDYFLKAKDLAIKQNKEISILICNHNLYHLARSIELRYWKLADRHQIVNELKSIDNYQTVVSEYNKKIKNLIIDNSFFTNAQIKLQTLKEEIIDKYNSYLRGGRSSNNFSWEIFYQYVTLYEFLNKNYVVYEHYSDYEDVINSLIESAFASYAIKNGMNNMSGLDDYSLAQFVLYAKPKDLEKLYKRYYLTKIDYDKSETKQDDFPQIFLNFLTNDIDELKIIFKSLPKEVSDKFWIDYNRYIGNFLFLASILKFNKDVVQVLSKNLIKFLESNMNWICNKSNEVSKYIYHFFIRQQEFIKPGIIKKILLLSYKYEDFFSEYLNIELIENSLELRPIVKFTDQQLSKVILPFIYKRLFEEDRLNQYNIVSHLYPLLNNAQKEVFVNFYDDILEQEFNYYLFYILVIYDVFDINYKNYLSQYFASIDLENDTEYTTGGFFSRSKTKRYGKIDSLLNMWFKYGFDLNDDRILKFKGINEYYDWLLNINNFDYKKFNPEWLGEFGTKYYFSHFKKSLVLKGKIASLLKEDFDFLLKRTYCDIYN